MENKNKLIIEFERLEKGVSIRILGQDKSIPWYKYVEQALPSIVESLEKEFKPVTGEEFKQSKENLIKAMADLADKTVEEVKKDLSKMKGDENVNIAKLSAEYMDKFLKKMNKKGKK